MLQEIGSETFTLKKLFRDVTYDIDYYQREYAWSADDVRTLLTDLQQEFHRTDQDAQPRRMKSVEPFFLGPFVYYDEKPDARFLVDGQQRFTTLHLIFLHLHDIARDFNDKATIDKLARAIMEYDSDGERFRLDIPERSDALRALFHGYDYELPKNSSLSLRNLWTRSEEIGEILESFVDSDNCASFVNWLLDNVVMVGIRALSRDNGFKIFESMNDRGAQLTQVDLVKSFLLSNVGERQEELNKRWREMLAELTRIRGDRDAPRKFLAGVLVARWANVGEDEPSEQNEIERAANSWIRKPENRVRVGLKRAGPDYFRFVSDLIGLSMHYVDLLRATKAPYDVNGLAAVYFNAVNGIDSQMSLILAALQPKDTRSEANRKAALVANYLDRLYVLRAVAFESADSKSLDGEVRRLIPLLRRCSTSTEVAAALSAEIRADSFASVLDFRMQGNNKAQVRYFVARLTSYVQHGTRKPDLVADYIGPERSWEIEHLWPNHPEWYADDVADASEYRALRARIGALVLLPKRDNNSLNDMPLADKISRYGRQNGLVAILETNYRRNHPDLRDFIKENDIEKYFRDFGAHARMQTIVDSRAELYRRLAIRVWDPKRLGFTPANPPDDIDPAAIAAPTVPEARPTGRKRLLQTDLAKMVRAGLIPCDTVLSGTWAGVEYSGTVNSDGQIVLSNGEAYDKPDEAARTASGKRQDGLAFWRLASGGLTLRQLKERAVADGTLAGTRSRTPTRTTVS